jgi:hypothetical protein
MFESQELQKLFLWRFRKIDLTKLKDSIRVFRHDHVAGNVCLLLREDGEGMGRHG